MAMRTSILHAVSPAGIFMIAGYTESPTCLLVFAASWLFELSSMPHLSLSTSAFYCICSGTLLGIAGTLRPSAVPFGLLFLWRLFILLDIRSLAVLNRRRITFIIVTGLSGILSTAGFLYSQYVAWTWYCDRESPRPWCNTLLPSIYSFVQAHYW
jgi:phosphatidylinositol glycan class V